MKKGLFTLLLLIITALPALSAPTNTTGPWGIDISKKGGFTNLSTAKRSSATAGKTMVISDVMNVNTLTIPSDRAIDIKKGGRIRYSGDVVINGPFSAGYYQVFEKVGNGTLRFGPGSILNSIPQWFGANGNDLLSDRVAIQDAVTAYRDVFIPPGRYMIDGVTATKGGTNDDGIFIKQSATIRGAGTSTQLAQSINSRFILRAMKDDSSELNDVTIEDIYFEGPQVGGVREDPTSYVVMEGELGRWPLELMMQVAGLHVKNFTVKGCTFFGPYGYGVALGAARFGETVYPDRNPENINILNNVFDGFDHNNAGGMILGGGINVLVQGNQFRNLSVAGEPGSIDIEADPYPYAIFKNIQIVNNKFSDTGGYGGHIQFYLPAGSYPPASPPQGFIVSGNVFTGTGGGVSIQVVPDIPFNTTISNNQYFGNSSAVSSGYGAVSQFLNNVSIIGNIFAPIGSTVPVVTIGRKNGANEDTIRKFTFVHNSLLGNSTSEVMILGGSVDTADILDNSFYGGYNSSLVLGLASASFVKSVTLKGNSFSGVVGDVSRAVYYNSTDSTHWNTNTALNNTLASGHIFQFPAYITDMVPSVDAPMFYPVFDAAVLPDSFPIGRSAAANPYISGLSATGGMLVTEKYTSEVSLRPSIMQWFYPSNTDGTSLTLVFFRKADTASNAWSAWKKIVGVAP